MDNTAESLAHEQVEAIVTRKHAERYPEGCRITGHHCEECMKRLEDTPHPVKSIRTGRRRAGFYRGEIRIVCQVQGCAY